MPKSRPHCPSCGKEFSSRSHLLRHQVSHNARRLIGCTSCNKTFKRTDTARRHMRTCIPIDQEVRLPTKRRGKQPRACDRCHEKKVSCDSEVPCRRCLSQQLECSFSRLGLSDRNSRATSFARPHPTAPSDTPWLNGFTDPTTFIPGGNTASSDDYIGNEILSPLGISTIGWPCSPPAYEPLSYEPTEMSTKSLSDGISLLLSDAYRKPDEQAYGRITRMRLYLLLAGLSLYTSIMKTNCLVSSVFKSLRRGCRRWKVLWDNSLEVHGDFAMDLGFSSHTVDLWRCVLAIIGVAESRDQTTNYIKGVPADSLLMLNEFFARYGDLGGHYT